MADPKKEVTLDQKPINRREFLNFAWLVSLGFLSVNMGGLTYFFAMPRFKEGQFGGTFTIGKVSDLPPIDSAPVNYPKVKLWLSNTSGGVLGIYKVCPHLGCLYGWNEQEAKFICPCHGSQFQADGEYIAGPAPRSLDRFVIQVVDPATGTVLAESADGAPMQVPDDPEAVIRIDTGKRVQGARHA